MVRTHTVVAGETLWALALRYYGEAELYRLVATASGVSDPSAINVGQRLIFPDFTRYTVAGGDTLAGLAERFYGDADLDHLIAKSNGIADGDDISAGRQLFIPDVTKYKVAAGDTLSALALRFYGDADLYPLRASTSCSPTTTARAARPTPCSTCSTAATTTSVRSTSWASETGPRASRSSW